VIDPTRGDERVQARLAARAGQVPPRLARRMIEAG
jgi:hypothetical protein